MIDYKKYITDKNINQVELADKIGYSVEHINRVLTGKGKDNLKFEAAFLKAFPDARNYDAILDQNNSQHSLNKTYKQSRENNTLHDSNTPGFKSEVKQIAFDEFEEVEYLSIQAQAGYLDAIESNIEPKLDAMLIPKEYEKGKYLIVEISGNSMDDGTARSIQDGDKLLCKELQKHHWTNKLHYKQYLFVIMSNEGIVCKQVTDHNVADGRITCHSWNPLYKDYAVGLDQAYKLFYVKKIVERRIKF